MKPRSFNDVVFSLPLVEVEYYKNCRTAFEKSRLGRIRALIPIQEIAMDVLKRMPKRKSNSGRKANLPLESQILLLFLRSYYGLSDARLLELLNGSIMVQMFCDVIIDPLEPIEDTKYISAIRNRIGKFIDLQVFQKYMAESFKPHMENFDTCMMDATCYESHLRYPTDAKLLWECCEWMGIFTNRICDKNHLNIRKPANNYKKEAQAYLVFAKKRKKPYKLRLSMCKSLIKLLNKQIQQCDRILTQYADKLKLSSEERKRLNSVKIVIEQQKALIKGEEVKNRVVSIDRPQIRPIIRGKENKRTEFGPKGHLILVDGLAFIHKLSFDAFNECTLLEDAVAFHESLFCVKVAKLGADNIYLTNDNRKFCNENKIVTNFVPKGRKTTDDTNSLIRSKLGKERATSMEGCFGNQKEHFDIKRVRARNQESEELQIYFAVMMSNACILADRIDHKKLLAASQEKETA